MCTPSADLVAESLALAEVLLPEGNLRTGMYLLPEGNLRIPSLGIFLRFSYGGIGMYLPPKSEARIYSSASEPP